METHSLGTIPSSITSTHHVIKETDDDSSTIRPENPVPNFSRKIRVQKSDDEQDLIQGFGFTFDRDLKASRVYMRILSKDSNPSCSSSVVPSVGWSFLSGLSLADISNVSALSLPISPNELWNAQYYSLDIPPRRDLVLSSTSLPLSLTESFNARLGSHYLGRGGNSFGLGRELTYTLHGRERLWQAAALEAMRNKWLRLKILILLSIRRARRRH